MPGHPFRKRNRPTLVCEACRRRKVACSREQPCSQCILSSTSCHYLGSKTSQAATLRQLQSNSSTSVSSASSTRNSGHSGRLSNHYEESAGSHVQSYPSSTNNLSVYDRSLEIEQLSHVPDQDDILSATELYTSFPDSDVGPFRAQKAQGVNGGPWTILRGRFVKSRLLGTSHWRSTAIKFEELARAQYGVLFDEDSDVYKLVDECKQLSKQLKQHCLSRPLTMDLRHCLPSLKDCRNLVDAYLRTFESVFRVLHVPTFERDFAHFWSTTSMPNDVFMAKLLPIMAIGACFESDSSSNAEQLHHTTALHWVQVAHAWLESPTHRERSTLGGLQIRCLVALAFQTNSIGEDFTRVFISTLLQSAMSIGLHRDPDHLPYMSIQECEIRRRLWATIMEILLQNSLDLGTTPLISSDDYDCRIPSNVDDEEIDSEAVTLLKPRPSEVFTQTTTQRTLAASIPLRLKVVRLLNGLHADPSYEDALRLGAELTNICRSNSRLFQSFIRRTDIVNSTKSLSFQVKLQDFLIRRFLLSLHAPFADKTCQNVTYYFSRRVSLESSLLLLSYSVPTSIQQSTPQSRREDDYTRLRVLGQGFFKHTYLLASADVCLELIADLREDSAPSTSVVPRDELHQSVQRLVETSRRRLREGDTNARRHVHFACALAHVEALRAERPVGPAVDEAAIKELETCRAILRNRLGRATAMTQLTDLGGTSEILAPSVERNNFFDPMIAGDEYLFSDPNLDFDSLGEWPFSPVSARFS